MQTYPPTHTKIKPTILTHSFMYCTCVCVCHAGGCLSWLTAVRAALAPVSEHFAKRAYYLLRWSPVEGPGIAPGGRFGSAAMGQALNWGDRHRTPCWDPDLPPPPKDPRRDALRSTTITKASSCSISHMGWTVQPQAHWHPAKMRAGKRRCPGFQFLIIGGWCVMVKEGCVLQLKHLIVWRFCGAFPPHLTGAKVHSSCSSGLWSHTRKSDIQIHQKSNRNSRFKHNTSIYYLHLILLNTDIFLSHPAASQSLFLKQASLSSAWQVSLCGFCLKSLQTTSRCLNTWLLLSEPCIITLAGPKSLQGCGWKLAFK